MGELIVRAIVLSMDLILLLSCPVIKYWITDWYRYVCVCMCGMCICVYMYMYMYVCVFVGSCLANKDFIRNLPAMDPGMGWVIIK